MVSWDIAQKPLEFFLERDEETLRDEEQARILCELMDTRFKGVKDFQIFASALLWYGRHELDIYRCDLPGFIPGYYIPREEAFQRIAELIQTLKIDRIVVNVCHNLGKVKEHGFFIVLDHFQNLAKDRGIKIEANRYKLLHLGSFNDKGRTIYFPLGVCKNSQTNPFILALCADIRTLVTDLFSARYVYYLLTQKEDLPVMETRSAEVLKTEYESMLTTEDTPPPEKISFGATKAAIDRSWINFFNKENHLFAQDDVVGEEKWVIESEEIYRVFLEQLEKCGYEIDKDDINKIKQKQSQIRVQEDEPSLEDILSRMEDDASETNGKPKLYIDPNISIEQF